MLSILGFLIVLGPLVVFHEFGHYIFARIFGVKAEIFSIGFGPRIWGKQIGETEWRVSVVPLGGYVKLLGEEGEKDLPPADKNRTLSSKPAWQRFFIFFGGPLFNFILAIFVFMAILAIGEPQMASVVGRAVQGSHAEKAGFQSGDKILAVNGKPVKRFEEVNTVVLENPGKPVQFQVLHPTAAQPIEMTVTPTQQDGFSVYGEQTHVGEIDGLMPLPRSTTVGISNPATAAAKAGFKTGDKITQFNGQAVITWEDIERIYRDLPVGAPFTVKGESTSSSAQPSLQSVKPAIGDLAEATGIHSSELFVEKTVAASPAEASGIKPGDRLVAIGPVVVQSFFELKDAVQRSGENEGKSDGKVAVRWERNGEQMSATITPTATAGRDPLLKKTTQFTIGVIPQLVWAEPQTVVERVWNPFMLVYKATERMAIFSWRNVVSIRKMVTGDVSIATLGGPILIGKIAGESLSRGLIAFLTTMAILSVGLGVLNILPIPVLDGGHLLLLAIEAVRGKPLTIRQMEIVQQVGLSLIVLLMVIVIRNDFERLAFFN